MIVTILNHTPNPVETVAFAAKVCYSSMNISDIKPQKHLVSKLIKSGHLSPLEHASFTFAVEGISRACSHQLVRHRLASYSQQSQRYVGLYNFKYIIPPSIEKNEDLKNRYKQFMESTKDFYNEIAKTTSYEDARFILPNATETKVIVTMNARELLHFFSQRCCNRAQWEIRFLANEMLRLVKEAAFEIFENAGPPCIRGDCPEGEFSCKRRLDET